MSLLTRSLARSALLQWREQWSWYCNLIELFLKKLQIWLKKPKTELFQFIQNFPKGKELETKLKKKKPGNLTDDLRISLGMPIGPNSDKVPPPWLIAMQRYGPPPSYPSLEIPGLNAPIPDVSIPLLFVLMFTKQ